jgi:hypothetical protein
MVQQMIHEEQIEQAIEDEFQRMLDLLIEQGVIIEAGLPNFYTIHTDKGLTDISLKTLRAGIHAWKS